MKNVPQPGVRPQRERRRQVKFRRKVHETISNTNTRYTGIIEC